MKLSREHRAHGRVTQAYVQMPNQVHALMCDETVAVCDDERCMQRPVKQVHFGSEGRPPALCGGVRPPALLFYNGDRPNSTSCIIQFAGSDPCSSCSCPCLTVNPIYPNCQNPRISVQSA